jgi:hypothetical protein
LVHKLANSTPSSALELSKVCILCDFRLLQFFNTSIIHPWIPSGLGGPSYTYHGCRTLQKKSPRYFLYFTDTNGVWREYPSGSPVPFHHFPDFRAEHGDAGDTLIWDAHLNRLFIDNDHKEYHALCYRLYQHGKIQTLHFCDILCIFVETPILAALYTNSYLLGQ